MNENNKGFRVNIGVATICFLLVCQTVGFAFGYGQLSQQVEFNRELIKSYQSNQQTIMTKLDDLTTRITKLEVTIISRND